MIRPYRPEDERELIDLWRRSSDLAHPFLDAAFQDQEARHIAELYLPNAETWVFESAGRLAGFLSLLGNEVGGLFVDPRLHRRGVGRALVEKARELRGDLEVEVFERNALGRAFYAALGFEPTGGGVHGASGFEVLRLRLPASDEAQRPRRPSTDLGV